MPRSTELSTSPGSKPRAAQSTLKNVFRFTRVVLPAGWLEICGFDHGVRMKAAFRSAMVNVGRDPGATSEAHVIPRVVQGSVTCPSMTVRRQILRSGPGSPFGQALSAWAHETCSVIVPGFAGGQSLRDMYS